MYLIFLIWIFQGNYFVFGFFGISKNYNSYENNIVLARYLFFIEIDYHKIITHINIHLFFIKIEIRI